MASGSQKDAIKKKYATSGKTKASKRSPKRQKP